MRKFLVRWWLTSNYTQDRYQQAIREWNEVRERAMGLDRLSDRQRALRRLFIASDSFNQLVDAAKLQQIIPR